MPLFNYSSSINCQLPYPQSSSPISALDCHLVTDNNNSSVLFYADDTLNRRAITRKPSTKFSGRSDIYSLETNTDYAQPVRNGLGSANSKSEYFSGFYRRNERISSVQTSAIDDFLRTSTFLASKSGCSIQQRCTDNGELDSLYNANRCDQQSSERGFILGKKYAVNQVEQLVDRVCSQETSSARQSIGKEVECASYENTGAKPELAFRWMLQKKGLKSQG